MIRQTLEKKAALIEKRLDELLGEYCCKGKLCDAMSYSLMAGGKRLRPALCLITAGLFNAENEALDFACCLEMIHTYSLIHDDLPAMDDDTLRRGKPTSHVVYGEGMAILAGDGLLNLAFEVMSDLTANADGDYTARYAKVMSVIAKASGVRGMIAGQAADLEFEGKGNSEEILSYIHDKKTAEMIKASVLCGAMIGGADDVQTERLEQYGKSIGLVFQIIDDILDVSGVEQDLGKSTGKDEAAGKQTFVSLYGIKKSKELAQKETQKAVDALGIFGMDADNLKQLAVYLLSRDR